MFLRTLRMSSRVAIAALVGAALIATTAPQAASSPGPRDATSTRAADKPPPTGDALLVEQLMAAGGGRTRIDAEPTTGKVSFVGFPAGTSWAPAGVTNAADVAAAFVQRYSGLFGAAPADVKLSRTTRTEQGGWTFRYVQKHRTVAVFGAELVLELDGDARLTTAAGKLVPLIRADTKPTVTDDKARSAARDAARRNWRHRSTDQVDTQTPQVTIYDPALLGRAEASEPKLAWRVKVEGSDEENPRAGFVFVDADNGTTLAQVDLAPTALSRKICDNRNSTTGPATCSSPVRTEGGAPSAVDQVNKAYDFLGEVYDFYQSRFGRDGINGAGQPMNAVVRYCDPQERCPYRNAFWDGTSTMVFGDGYATDDVTGHELTHGVTQSMSGLVYTDQSGAINESLSDVMGEFLDLTNGVGNDAPGVRWLLGEELPDGALRSMLNPLASLVPQPDSMLSSLYARVALTVACGDANDSCGVHTNSGVGNKAAYLITDGGVFNGYTVTGLGIDKAAQVYYKAMGLLTSTSRYRDLYNALVQGCTNLVGGAAGITADDCVQVKAAVDATGMNLSPLDAAAGAVQNLPACTAKVFPRNDEGSTRVNLPFGVNFGGLQNSLYVNNNGNVTFGAPLASSTPFPLAASTGLPIIAPFFADVDTRAVRSDEVTYGASADGTTFCVNWAGSGVGYFNTHAVKLNRFQLLLIDRAGDPDGAAGDFDIVFDYSQVAWETGDSDGGSSGLGGRSARVGYSAGTGLPRTSLEFPGSGVPGSFLDGSATALKKGKVGSLQDGRYVYRFRDGFAAPAGSVSGSVYQGTATAGNALAGAIVAVCPQLPVGGECTTATTNSAGRYRVSGLAAGTYVVTAYSPGDSPALPGRLPPLLLGADAALAGQDVVLEVPLPIPAGTTLTNLTVTPAGLPVLDWDAPLALETHGCPGATASYRLTRDGADLRTGALAEGPAGTYTATLAALRPETGYARLAITLTCPADPPTLVAFDVYVRPSGIVVDTLGNPVEGATVTLYRSDTGAAGPFTAVPGGSGVMSPANRAVPSLTNGAGLFGWDVVPGTYRIRAERDRCSSPTVGGQAYAETAALTVPPAMTGVRLVLACTAPPVTRDVISVKRTGSAAYTFTGGLVSGDYTVDRNGVSVQSVRGTGRLAGGRSATFSLIVTGGRATGWITLTNFKSRFVDRIPVDGARVTADGHKVGGMVTWTRSNRTQQLLWVIDDRLQ